MRVKHGAAHRTQPFFCGMLIEHRGYQRLAPENGGL